MSAGLDGPRKSMTALVAARRQCRASLLYALVVVCLMCTMAPAAGQANGTNVTLHTSVGDIPIELLDDTAPATVQNFLAYVDAGDYACTLFHRLAFSTVAGQLRPFVLQGGGYTVTGTEFTSMRAAHIPTRAPVVNEFGESNVRATLAMAKLGGNPNSATSEWFINLSDNSDNLDNQNGGFTVFGQVIAAGMSVVDQIAAIPRFNVTGLSSAFGDMPLRGIDTNAPVLRQSSFVRVNGVSRSGSLPTVVVPDLSGLTSAQANQRLADGPLILESARLVLSNSAPKGTVASQSLSPGERVGACSLVALELSGIAAPSLSGFTRQGATAALQSAGLVDGAVTSELSDEVPRGRVIRQVPGANTLVLPGTPVAYVLSDGRNPADVLSTVLPILFDD